MEYITEWVKNLIFLILFSTFLMLFLPENKMRKYVRVIMGFFIITIFISPLASIFNQNFAEFSHIIPERIVANDLDLLKRRGEGLQESNQTILNEYYGEKVKKQMTKVVKLEFPEWQHNIDVNIDESYQIKKIQIVLQQSLIEDVEIKPMEKEDIKAEEENENNNIQQTQKVISLKNKISNMLQVPLNIINIEFRGEGDGNF